jgi:hypothetical protein
MVSSRHISQLGFGSSGSVDGDDVEQGAANVQYRLQAVAVRDLLYSCEVLSVC